MIPPTGDAKEWLSLDTMKRALAQMAARDFDPAQMIPPFTTISRCWKVIGKTKQAISTPAVRDLEQLIQTEQPRRRKVGFETFFNHFRRRFTSVRSVCLRPDSHLCRWVTFPRR